MSLLDHNIIWATINFLVLMYLLNRFLYSPVMKIMEERRAKIEGDLDHADREREKANELRQEYKTKLAGAEEEARRIIEEGYQKAQEKREEIIASARQEAKREQERARVEIARAQAEARAVLRDEISDLALLAAGRFLERKLTGEEHEALMEKVVQELPQEVGGSP